MNKFLLNLFLSIFLLQFANSSTATNCNSVANGNWSAAGTWSCGRKPNCGDTIFISHTVTITATEDNSACALPMFITVNATGILHYNMGRKLKLPCGSGLSLLAGAQITAAFYSGANNQLEICGAEVWRASDGPQTGPLIFGSGLPIELLSFVAKRNNENVKIDWITATETNNDYFTIERSENGYDFEPIFNVNGAGTSNAELTYSKIDFDAPVIGIYYRLKQTDHDGRSSWSQIEYVEPMGNSEEILLYPNPTDGLINVILNDFSDEHLKIEFSDITGRICYQFTINPNSDYYFQSHDLKNELAAGSYVVTFATKSKFFTQKLIVK